MASDKPSRFFTVSTRTTGTYNTGRDRVLVGTASENSPVWMNGRVTVQRHAGTGHIQDNCIQDRNQASAVTIDAHANSLHGSFISHRSSNENNMVTIRYQGEELTSGRPMKRCK